MPCVLPGLSLKLRNVVGHGGGARGTVRLGLIASAAGIVFSFLLLAGFLVVLKAGGMAVGWGIQFQQPVFLVAMTAILVLRSEEHTSELQSLMRISYAVFCLKKKNKHTHSRNTYNYESHKCHTHVSTSIPHKT